MPSQADISEADAARSSGNELYQAGELLQGELLFAALAPEDPRPFSNLSAVRFELGDYKTASLYANKAIALTGVGHDAPANQDKLYGRLAKCHLYLLDVASAENAISKISGTTLQAELQGWAESLKSLVTVFPDQAVFQRSVLDEFRRYKPAFTDEPFFDVTAQDSDISLFFAGCGDGRNVLNTIVNIASKEAASRRKVSRLVHITALDLKPATIARLLILLDLILQIGIESSMRQLKPGNADHDGFIAIAYLFSCQVIPPTAAGMCHDSISRLIKSLEAGEDGVEIALVRDCGRNAIVRVLRQWQKPYPAMSTVADVREHLEGTYWPGKDRAAEDNGPTSAEIESEKRTFRKITTLLPSLSFAEKHRPGLAKALQEHWNASSQLRLREAVAKYPTPSLTRRRTEVTMQDLEKLPPEMKGLFNPFTYEDYMIWEATPKSVAKRGPLLSKPEFEKWIYGHLLKICLPYPRPTRSSQPVHAPLNLASLFSFLSGMFEVGYPAHWITNILSCVCSGQITTSARPPRHRIAEFTTLLSVWRRLLPFGTDAAGGALIAGDKIAQYRISFPSPRNSDDLSPHLILLFWNPKYKLDMFTSNYDVMCDGSSSVEIREQGMVCVTTFQYATKAKEATFWLREDVMEKMQKENWQVCIWRTDSWASTSGGAAVANALRCKSWTELSCGGGLAYTRFFYVENKRLTDSGLGGNKEQVLFYDTFLLSSDPAIDFFM
ncbi:hypothetical protein NLG97_g3351 [Lecanicillium saksenae]|uniref:Uncharacterized protein n=1 Tax=Lecanicillium saksenae TaxID=468837 RepID=A0ACC1QZK5_9HYPO|nr:hypothetical protein NLG97_g3351 [Lecanicillium saksenae]